MAFALRFLGYIVGGGALLAWVNPYPGPWRWLATLLYILAAAYLDFALDRAARTGRKRHEDPGVAKIAAYRSSRRKKTQPDPSRSERRKPRPLFDTSKQGEAEGLVALLRAKGLSPIMVTRRLAEGDASIMYEVRLPEAEFARARILMSQYMARKSAPHD